MNLFISCQTILTTTLVAPIQNAQQTNALDSLGLLGLEDTRISSQSLTTSISTSIDSNNSNILNIEVTFYNISTQKLQIQPPSSIGILSSAAAQQQFISPILKK
ncbi:10438_t:CDS:2 [Gigaspora margarita]|uniref:10438_t:CDS:1 n=1 Tax=Gigaspora margarita TaxID=4874 RepID=A0ABN7WDA2_GIGMA|nr:10438_t:CDS:2 [Gigaspora margarita]